MKISYYIRKFKLYVRITHNSKSLVKSLGVEVSPDALFTRKIQGEKYINHKYFVDDNKPANSKIKSTTEKIVTELEELSKIKEPTLRDIEGRCFSKETMSITIHSVVKEILEQLDNGKHLNKEIKSTSIRIIKPRYEKMLLCDDVDISKYNYVEYKDPIERNIVENEYKRFITQYLGKFKATRRKQMINLHSNIRTLFKYVWTKYGYNLTGIADSFHPGGDDDFEVEIIPPDIVDYVIENIPNIRAKLTTKNRKTDLDNVFDYILFGLATALRRGDLCSLTDNEILSYNKEGRIIYELKKYTKKRDRLVKFELPPFICDMLSYNKKQYGMLLRPITQPVFFRNISSVFSYIDGCDFVYDRTRLVDNERQVIKSKPFHELITPHTLRRTAASYMYSKGALRDTIEFIGGWSTGSTCLNRYIYISQEKYNAEYGNVWTKKEDVKLKKVL